MLNNNIVQRTLQRMKRFWIVLIIIPLLTASVAYIMAARVPVTYTAESEIMLGNFDDTTATNIGFLEEALNSPTVFQEDKILYKGEYGAYNAEQFASKLRVSTDRSHKTIILSLPGSNRDQIEESLTSFVDEFMEYSRSALDRKYDIYKEEVKAIKDIETEYEKVDKSKQISNIYESMSEMRPTLIKQPVEVSQTSNDPVQRAILGLLIGIMINIILLALPEIFRDEEKAQKE
ncbi:hypothetical protein [Pseudalkalibacillus caeni]|uniref:Polysaccharide chain length determinant N-terminal domain-containing protein n=1 Tax=Exobacillus caeni TaxID=2574798 RepID=A0A5R9F651_9BACL|nr:hypothetical protein [Pseudalkalibacillus caeni]TLS38501.1 hypothetical protein FCL54_05010 [Pseudalkalibacillus caeni]